MSEPRAESRAEAFLRGYKTFVRRNRALLTAVEQGAAGLVWFVPDGANAEIYAEAASSLVGVVGTLNEHLVLLVISTGNSLLFIFIPSRGVALCVSALLFLHDFDCSSWQLPGISRAWLNSVRGMCCSYVLERKDSQLAAVATEAAG